MKLKSLISVLLVTVLLAACTKEVFVEVEVPVYVEKESTVRFKLYTSFFTKGTNDHDTTVPSIEERRVFNYSVLIFHADGQLEAVLKAAPYDLSVPESAPIDVDMTVPLAFQDEEGNELVITLTSGEKQIFGLVNAPQSLWNDWLETVDENKTIDDYKEYLFNVREKGGLDYITGMDKFPTGEERGFLMTSGNGLETIYLQPTDDDHVLDLSISVGRGMAKVSVASDLATNPRNVEQQPNGELTNITYKIKNNPNEMYVIPSVNTYSYTPYFYSQSLGEVNANLYFESPGTLDNNYVPISRRNALTHLYCMENGNESPNNQNSTLIVIKGTYTPDILYMADGTTLFTGYQTGQDFWRVIEIVNGERGDYTDKYYGEDPANFMTENQRSVRYINGETYYFLYLDREETNQFPYPHNYTVKRNSYYNIDITKVRNAGDEKENPDIDLPGPGPGPDPSDDPRITVTITIQDWDLIRNNAEL